MADFHIKKGDRLPSMTCRLRDAAGLKDLTGASGVTFAMKLQNGVTIVTGTVVVLDASGGKVRYDWGVSDTAVIGVYDGEFIVTTGGLQQTFPNDGFFTVEVEQDAS